MSVCMSAVLAGISEVLIKYTGNVWLHTISYKWMKWKFSPLYDKTYFNFISLMVIGQ